MRARIVAMAAELPPGAFAFVMATGIVSTAISLLGWRRLALALLAVNVAAYGVLALLSVVRLATVPERVAADLHSHARAPGCFTTVAGTCVLGTQFVILLPRPALAALLWSIGVALWVVLIYAFFLLLTIGVEKPRLEEGLNGSWMLLVVGTQSVAVLGTLLAPGLPVPAAGVLGATLALFLLGCMFYLVLFSLILYRFLFVPLDPAELTPPYWINMGAVAITTLSGSLLILRAEHWRPLGEFLPFLRGFTLMFWATATWWIPLLLLLGAWRHLARRFPLRFSVQFWSMVFPIGMYTVATARLSEALGWPALQSLAPVVGPLALGAWILASAGLVRELLHG